MSILIDKSWLPQKQVAGLYQVSQHSFYVTG